MCQASSIPQPIPLPVHCECDRTTCHGEVVVVDTPAAREVFIRCDPATFASGENTPEQQAEQFYGCMPRILGNAGATMANVVLERVFFQDLDRDFDAFSRVREAAYAQAGVTGDQLPVSSYVGQPPCRENHDFEMQVYALVPHSKEAAKVTNIPADGNHPAAKLIEIGGYRHFYARNITGRGADGQPLGTMREQCDAMFQTAADMLKRQGTDFRKVLRTWCYLVDIDADYDEFNSSRNEFFERHGIERLPASTGINAELRPPGAVCSTDLYALLNPEGAEIEVMHTPTLNEAAEYGSAFSRGMKVGLPDKTVLFISGTASIDDEGETVHLDNVRKQIERTLLNIQELLANHGGTFENLVQVITYLKSADDLDLFLEVWEEQGLGKLPNSIVEAHVCRPELLCEIEAIAVLPNKA